MIQNLQEALPLSTAKKYTKMSNKKYKELYPDIFKDGKDRQFFPFQVTLKPEDSIIYKDVEKVMNNRGYKITDYKGGYAVKVKEHDDDGNPVLGKNKEKIGGLIKDFIKAESEWGYDGNYDFTSQNIQTIEMLYEAFVSDPFRSGGGEYNIVISRHPYDIAGMSTDRFWDSCMAIGQKQSIIYNKEIGEGMNSHYLPKDIEAGTLVAYLVNKNEKPISFDKGGIKQVDIDSDTGNVINKNPLMRPKNIKDPLIRPLARVSIRPYLDDSGKGIYLNVAERIYGIENLHSFQKEVQRIIDELHNDKSTDIMTKQYKKHRGVYQDTDDPSAIGLQYSYNGNGSIMIDHLHIKIQGWYRTLKSKMESGVVITRTNPETGNAEFSKDPKDILVPFGKYPVIGSIFIPDRSNANPEKVYAYIHDKNQNYTGIIQVYPEEKPLLKPAYVGLDQMDYEGIYKVKSASRLYGIYNIKLGKWIVPCKFGEIHQMQHGNLEYYQAIGYDMETEDLMKVYYDKSSGELIPNPEGENND